MAIIWDSPLTAATAKDLDRALAGDRFRAFHMDRAGSSVLLYFRNATLTLRLAPDAGEIVLQEATEPLEEARTLAADVESVGAPPDDRVLLFRMRRPRGSRQPVLVAVELMTNQWNVVVAREWELTIRHVLRERTGGRPLRPGAAYEPPPPSSREGVEGDLTLERWKEILAPVPVDERKGVLLRRVAWSSPVNAAALLGGGAGLADEAALEAGHALWLRITSRVSDPEPVLLRGEDGPQPYPCPLPGVEHEPVSSVLRGFEKARDATATAGASVIPSGWIERLEKRARSARGRVRGLTRELENAPDPQEIRAVGDLILARFGEVPRGVESATLTGFQGDEVEVELDPTLRPDENAERYYDEAARAQRARERLPRMIEEARREAEDLGLFLERVHAGEATPAEVREALPEPSPGGSRSDDEASLPYRRFRSTGGLEIRVGRGAKRNDDLTFRHSNPDDIWLHARHTAGAHVILRWNRDDNPPARDLAEAATLAALASRARTSGSVPVDWTRRKYVRKPRKAPPGAVVPGRVQTVFVEPKPEMEERLREE